jgi:4-hydroxybenzoate polyprenyltransferase
VSHGAAASAVEVQRSPLATWIAVARPHILSIVFASTLTYGWIFTDRHDLLIPLVAVWDWFIVNWMNKAADIEEDLANGVTGAQEVARKKRAVEGIGVVMIAIGFALGAVLAPSLTPWRVLFTGIGLLYNYRLIPWVRGGKFVRTRFKETYFFKNFGSSMLFTLSVFIYPLFGLGAADEYPFFALIAAIAFFIPLELTYEIIYDLRDVDGDQRLGIPTYPVVHGPSRAKQIIYGLLFFSALAPIAGALTGELRVREWCVVAAVVQQVAVMQIFCRGDRIPTQSEAVFITYLGTSQLLAYNLWVFAGLPLGA